MMKLQESDILFNEIVGSAQRIYKSVCFLANRTDSLLFVPLTFLVFKPLFGGMMFPSSFVNLFVFLFIFPEVYRRWNNVLNFLRTYLSIEE